MKLSVKLLAKLVLCLALATTAFMLPACDAGDASAKTKTTDLKIVASVFAPYDFSRQIAGDKATVTMLVPPGSETHSFEPSPQDIMQLQSADIFIYVGGESDAWLEDILDSIDTSEITLIRLMNLVPILDEAVLEGLEPESDASGTGETREPDEHVWTSIGNAKLIVSSLATTFAELDPENAATYNQNSAAYLAELTALDQRYRSIVETAQRNTMVVADRFPFTYLAKEYGLECYAAFSGCSTAVDTNPQTIVFLINKVEELDLPVVFYIELSSHRIAHAISESTNAKELLLHSAHNISKQDFEAGLTYLEIMNQNASNLEEALN